MRIRVAVSLDLSVFLVHSATFERQRWNTFTVRTGPIITSAVKDTHRAVTRHSEIAVREMCAVCVLSHGCATDLPCPRRSL